MKKVKVYVGCSLTHAPPGFRQAVEDLKDKLRQICEVLEFKGISDDFIPNDIYRHDILGCVCESDLLLAICDYPSLGLGWEMAVQSEKRAMPVLAVAGVNAKVSKLVLDPQLPGYEFERYTNLREDVYRMVAERIKNFE